MSNETAELTHARDQVFLMDIVLGNATSQDAPSLYGQHEIFGERAYIRFYFDATPAAWQLIQAAHRLLHKVLDNKIEAPMA